METTMSSKIELLDITDKRPTASTNCVGKKMSGVTTKALIFVFLVLALALVVGLIVLIAGSANNVECKCSFPTAHGGNIGGSSAVLDQCKELASDGNTDICTTCPAQGTPTPCPTSAATDKQTPTGGDTTTSGPPTTAAPPTVLDVRLPTALNPLLYTVELQPHMYSMNPDEFTFTGSVKILLHCIKTANNITLHINKINITGQISVEHDNGIDNLYKRHEFDTERQFIVIYTTKEMIAGQNYVVNIPSFVGPLAPDLSGLYLSSYTRGNDTIYLAATQMEPLDARKAFPCLDEPAIKSEFDVTLVRKDHMVSLSNMPIAESTDRGHGWIADRFERSPTMSTYLLAFIICDFTYMEDVTKNGIAYRAWSRPESIEQTEYALQVGVEILTFYEEFFNVSYPLPKQDMIAIPDFGPGAMENWGLIVYRETAMLYQPGVSSEGDKKWVALIVSHELAHQWFGNLVSPKWWDDLWLNEGFATYIEYFGMNHVHPDWKVFEQFVVEEIHDVFNFDGLVSSHPVYVPVEHPAEIFQIFDKISYAKGASILRMMNFFLGNEIFQDGVTNYLNSLRYKAATHNDLWFALGNQSELMNNTITNVKEIMDTWTLQMNYPVVMVVYEATGQIILTQHRYLQDHNATDTEKYISSFGYKWHIPFTYTTSTELKFNVISTDVIMMTTDADHVHIHSDNIPSPVGMNWVIGNPMQYGFYRVNYDERNWMALIEQLRHDHTVIHVINRAQIINDAWSLARSGEISITIALRMMEYLNHEKELIPWDAAFNELQFVGLMLQKHPLYGSFMKFVQDKTKTAFEELTMNNTGATHLESAMRVTITTLACDYGLQTCVDEAKNFFSRWMADPENNPIDPSLRYKVYCTAIAEGGIDEWEFALDQYRKATVVNEKFRLQDALACSKQTWILRGYLEMSIAGDDIRLQDAPYVIIYIAKNPIGRSLAWDFVRGNWNDVVEMSEFSIGRVISAITSTFNTAFDEQQLKEFVDSRGDLGYTLRAFDQVLEKTHSNIKWMAANIPVIETWLHEQGY